MADAQSAAAQYGYSLAFFDSNPELRGLLDKAVSGNYDSSRFVAELRNTNWFRDSSESYRKYTALANSDPNTLRQQVMSTASKISTMASQLGASLPAGGGDTWLADQALRNGWNDDQIKQMLVMGNFFQADRNGAYGGKAGALQSQFKQMVSDYGVDVSDDTIGQWVKQGAIGQIDPEGVKNQLVAQAASKYPPYAERLKAGESMRQIADPYIQSQAKLLEMNPETIDWRKDQQIQSALVTKDKDGKPTSKTVWQFEGDLRHDPRWAKTQNAQDGAMSTANKILQSFGVIS